jgi:hypothetical protein
LKSGPTGTEAYHRYSAQGRHTAPAATPRSTFKIEDPSRGPGRVVLAARTKDLASRGPRNLRSKGTLPPTKKTLICGPPPILGTRPTYRYATHPHVPGRLGDDQTTTHILSFATLSIYRIFPVWPPNRTVFGELPGSRIRQAIRSRLRRLRRGSRIRDPGSSPNTVRNSGGQAGNSNGPWPGVFGAPAYVRRGEVEHL